jgi:regulatory protein
MDKKRPPAAKGIAEKGRQARTPKVPRKITPRYLENAALYYLQRYATSSGNLRTVLKRKIQRSCLHHKTDPSEFDAFLETLIGRYISSGLLNDKVYAEGRVNSLRRQGLSAQAIRAKLKLKGLPAAEIDAALTVIDESNEAEDSELAAALALTKRKKIGRYRKAPLKDPKDGQKEMAALGRAGFSYDVARRALDWKEDEDV